MRKPRRLPPGRAGLLEYNMQSYLEAAVAKYKQLAGVSALRKVTTPFIEDVDPDPVVNSHAAGKGGASAGGDALDTQTTSELKNCAASALPVRLTSWHWSFGLPRDEVGFALR